MLKGSNDSVNGTLFQVCGVMLYVHFNFAELPLSMLCHLDNT